MDIARVLQKRGFAIQPTRYKGRDGVMQLTKSNTSIEELRRMGFRVCQSPENEKLLLYYRGRFCGIVV